jgi:hypothetical protein
MRITSNKLMQVNKNISVVNNCLFAAEGPNCVGKMDLSSLSIKYDSFFSANMTLQPQDKDTPIMYGFLGTEITFISIVAHYNNNQQVCPTDNYIEYFFEDQPLIRRTFTDILVLSGNDKHRIQQMYVYNPSEDNVVNLEIMVANVDVNKISTLLNPTYNDINGLSFNSIITDQIYGLDCTGSTQFEILDSLASTGSTNVVNMVISFGNIDIMEIKENTILITTTSDDPIRLVFLSEFNALQTFSKMNWVMESSENRYITTTQPTIDTTSPVITFKPTPVITTLPVDKDYLNWRYIDSVVDDRDGIINNSNVEINIINTRNGEQLDEITEDGNYLLTFTISDLAGNKTIESTNLNIDSTGPIIYFNQGINNQMDLSSTTQTPGIIYYDDIIRYYIDNIWDDVDGVIPNSATTISITPSGTSYNVSAITELGFYDVDFVVADKLGNATIENRPLEVLDHSQQYILYNNVFCDSAITSTITMGLYDYSNSSITSANIRDYAISAITDGYHNPIDISYLHISPDTIITHGTHQIIFTISGVSNSATTETKDLNVIDTIYPTINYNNVFSGTSNSAFTMELYNSATTNRSAITMTDIIDYTISSIIGICPINIHDINVTSVISGTSALTSVGDYTINYDFTYLNNITIHDTKTLTIVDKSYPNIIFNNVFTGDDFTMSLSGDTVSGTEITITDLIVYSISAITDDYYGDASVDFEAILAGRFGVNFPLQSTGLYTINFETEDNAGNITRYTKNLTVTN